jgi:phosphatidylglycerophosphate synthase
MVANLFNPSIMMPFSFGSNNVLIMQVLLINWILMIVLYMLQNSLAMSTQFGQATTGQIWLSLASYFTYAQLFIVVSVHAVISVCLDAIFRRNGNIWVKTKRFD